MNEPAYCVLVAEDEPLVTMLLEDLLGSVGYRVLIATRVEEALAMLTEHPVDAAILDIRLGPNSSFPVADECQRREIPFLFSSGHGAEALPARFQNARLLLKPYHMKAVLDALNLLLTFRGTGPKRPTG